MVRRYWLIRFSAYARVIAITIITGARETYHLCKLLKVFNVVLEPVDHVLMLQFFASTYHSITRETGPFIPIWKSILKEEVSKELLDGVTEHRLNTWVLF